MINKVPEKIINNIYPESNHTTQEKKIINQHLNVIPKNLASEQILDIENENISNLIMKDIKLDEERVEQVLAQHSIGTGILTTVVLVGGWFFLVNHIKENKMTSVIMASLFLFAILTLTQFIIWVTYFVLLSQKDEKNADRVLGDWSGSVVITPLLSLMCVIFLFVFGVINKI